MKTDNDKPWFLVSLYDKEPYEDWISKVHEEDQYRFLGTSGTASWLQEQEIPCESVADIVGLDPRLQGKVKTLHPDLYSGIMATDRSELTESIPFIEGVCVSLTPFRREGSFVPGKVDIGGPSLLRAAAKSWQHVEVISSPELAEYHAQNLPTDESDRKVLARGTLQNTLRYDKDLMTQFDEGLGDFETTSNLTLTERDELRYGENPSQEATVTRDLFQPEEKPYELLRGNGLSYTNCLDIESAHRLARSEEPIEISVIKHTNPTGWARGSDASTVLEKAWSGDPKSAFGSVIGVNTSVNEDLVRAIGDRFVEGLVAPEFSDHALELLESNNIRAIRWNRDWSKPRKEDIQPITEGYLVQEAGHELEHPDEWETVSEVNIGSSEDRALRQMWKVCRWVTSNSAVVGTTDQVLGVGAGQQSRVDAVKLAVDKYREHHDGDSDPLVLASDGFFPFPDNVEVADEAGVDAIVSPGGSVKDDQVLEAAKQAGIGMIFTHTRGFSH